MRASAGEFDFGNWSATLFTGLASTVVDLEIGDEVAQRTIAPDIITSAGATLGNC